MKPYYSNTLPVAEVIAELLDEFPQIEYHLTENSRSNELDPEISDLYARINELEQEVSDLNNRINELEQETKK